MTENLLNRRFGKLLVIAFLGKRGRSFWWKCVCDCGNEHEARMQNLKSGSVSSCGCLAHNGETKTLFRNEMGNKYANLTATKYVGNGTWEFLCDCGQVCVKSISDVRRGKTRSCGCLAKEYQRKLKMGEIKSPTYNPNITKEQREEARSNREYREWQKDIKIRDGFACQKCGQIGRRLVSHHILSFGEFPELRYDKNNGITFCEKCHKDFHHRYGVKRFDKCNLLEFMQHVV